LFLDLFFLSIGNFICLSFFVCINRSCWSSHKLTLSFYFLFIIIWFCLRCIFINGSEIELLGHISLLLLYHILLHLLLILLETLALGQNLLKWHGEEVF
jgi:hypothetical protein